MQNIRIWTNQKTFFFCWCWCLANEIAANAWGTIHSSIQHIQFSFSSRRLSFYVTESICMHKLLRTYDFVYQKETEKKRFLRLALKRRKKNIFPYLISAHFTCTIWTFNNNVIWGKMVSERKTKNDI